MMSPEAEQLYQKMREDESMSIDTMALCELCGEALPYGEHMFKYHGHSGPCPKPPKQEPAAKQKPSRAARIAEVRAFYNDMIQLQQSTDIVSINKVLDALDNALEVLDAS